MFVVFNFGGASRTPVAEGGGALWRARPKAAAPQRALRYRKVLRACSKSERVAYFCGADDDSSSLLASMDELAGPCPEDSRGSASGLGSQRSLIGRPAKTEADKQRSKSWRCTLEALPRFSRAGYARPAWTGARRSCTLWPRWPRAEDARRRCTYSALPWTSARMPAQNFCVPSSSSAFQFAVGNWSSGSRPTRGGLQLRTPSGRKSHAHSTSYCTSDGAAPAAQYTVRGPRTPARTCAGRSCAWPCSNHLN